MAGRWPSRLPTLILAAATVREVRQADAAALAATMAEPSVQRFVAPALSVEEVSGFIKWAREERRQGRFACFAVVPHDVGIAAGVFQLWPVGRASGIVELGFALDRRLWGTGVFKECADAIIDFAIDHMNVHRIEARAAVDNRRGLAALAKLGAVREGVLRHCCVVRQQPTDCEMWSILPQDRTRDVERPQGEGPP